MRSTQDSQVYLKMWTTQTYLTSEKNFFLVDVKKNKALLLVL